MIWCSIEGEVFIEGRASMIFASDLVLGSCSESETETRMAAQLSSQTKRKFIPAWLVGRPWLRYEILTRRMRGAEICYHRPDDMCERHPHPCHPGPQPRPGLVWLQRTSRRPNTAQYPLLQIDFSQQITV
jgi:hypothetical protein